MPTHIALLRGINVGGKNLLAMKDLARLLESLDLRKVRTYLQSGNVVFQSSTKSPATLSNKIAAAISESRGFKPHVLVFSAAQLENAITANPFPEAEADPKTLHLFFLASLPTDPDLESLAKLKAPDERFHLTDHVFYLHAPSGIARSKLAAQAEKRLGVPATARNWRTVMKLMDLAAAV